MPQRDETFHKQFDFRLARSFSLGKDSGQSFLSDRAVSGSVDAEHYAFPMDFSLRGVEFIQFKPAAAMGPKLDFGPASRALRTRQEVAAELPPVADRYAPGYGAALVEAFFTAAIFAALLPLLTKRKLRRSKPSWLRQSLGEQGMAEFREVPPSQLNDWLNTAAERMRRDLRSWRWEFLAAFVYFSATKCSFVWWHSRGFPEWVGLGSLLLVATVIIMVARRAIRPAQQRKFVAELRRIQEEAREAGPGGSGGQHLGFLEAQQH